MNCYLFAGKNEDYTKSAYAFVVSGGAVQCGSHLGWTVQEAYLNGLRDLSDYIIKHHYSKEGSYFELCTPSKMIITVVTTDRLERLHDNHWKNPDGRPLFHVPILQELYYHRLYYKERDIVWGAAQEIAESEYFRVEQCKKAYAALF